MQWRCVYIIFRERDTCKYTVCFLTPQRSNVKYGFFNMSTVICNTVPIRWQKFQRFSKNVLIFLKPIILLS